MLEYRNPKFSRADRSMIDMEVLIDLEWLPFSARPDDVESYSRALFADALGSAADYVPPVFPPPASEDVNAERDRRIVGGFVFKGVHFQSDAEARENIAGAAQLAFAAIVQGAAAGDLHWHGEPSDFEWIAFDDTRVPMDAHTMFAFGQAALAHKRTHIFAANDLKKLDPIPADFIADQYWP